MRSSIAGFWLLLLIAGLALVARPAARQARRQHDGLVAGRTWQRVLSNPRGEAGPGAPCAWLSAPAWNLETLVLAGAGPERLHRAPCLDRVAGNTVILGHRDTHFAPLRRARSGDPLALQDRRGVTTTYTVSRTLVLTAQEAEAFIRRLPARDALVLVTCHPFRWVGPAPDRFVVAALPAPTGASMRAASEAKSRGRAKSPLVPSISWAPSRALVQRDR